MKSDDKTLIEALEILASDIESGDGVANACIAEASQRLRELTEWQPIQTAPKRKQILLYADGDIVSGRWKRKQWLYAEKEIDGTDIFFGSPTHWMPLPAPPKEGE